MGHVGHVSFGVPGGNDAEMEARRSVRSAFPQRLPTAAAPKAASAVFHTTLPSRVVLLRGLGSALPYGWQLGGTTQDAVQLGLTASRLSGIALLLTRC